ncbi:MAG: catecholate siderophore receptor Fiu [Gammaproteobacteria bacterium]|nr:MAG: catecholate siderophore receptor Fiu [Gammaproteobacteria bacterium]
MRKTTSNFIVAKKHTVAKQLKVSALSSVMLLAAGAMAAEDAKKDDQKAESGNKLGTVKVNADAINADFKAEKVSSDKFTQPLVDTPQTIVVVKKELFQQQAATSLSETLRNTPGITMLLGENGNTATGDSIFMRGFDTQGSIFVDGIRDLGAISRDTFNTEQVEIAKGPAGVDNGRGASSGYINLSSKKASLEDAITGNVTLGTADYKRSTLDVNKSLNETTALRVNLLAQDAGVDGRDEVESNAWGIATSLGLGLGTETRTYLNFYHVEQSGVPDGGVSTIGHGDYRSTALAALFPGGIPALKVDTETFYGSTDDHNDVSATMFTVRVEHDIAEGVTLRNTSRYGRSTQDLVLTGVNGVTAPGASLTNLDTWTIALSRQGRDQVNQILTNQTNLLATFDAGGVKHDLSTGVEFIYESQFNDNVGLPYLAADSATRVTQANANLYNPRGTPVVYQPVVHDGTKTDGETSTAAIYALDTISLNEQWQVSVGIRAERFYTKTDQILRQGAVTAPAVQTIPVGTYLGRDASLEDNLISWKVGGTYKPAENGSIYVSYATSQLPPGSSNFALNTDPLTASSNANSPNLEPQKGTNQELGTKWNVFDNKLALTAAVFKSTNENEIAVNGDGSSVAVGERQVSGIELGAAGIIMQNWQISAGFAYMDPEITRGNQSTANGGAAQTDGGVIQWSPEYTFTLWNSYAFSNGLTLGGGARYIDSVASSSLTNEAARANRSMLIVPDYWVFDAMAAYAISKNISLQLNILNIADEAYIGSLNNSGARYFPGAPRSFRLGANFTF